MRDESSKLRRHLRAVAGVILLAAAACSDATAPRYVPSIFSVSAGMELAAIAARLHPGVSVSGGTIRVDNDMTTPTPCFKLSGLALMEGTTLIVRVSARPALAAGQMCNQMVQPWLYMVTIPNAPANVRAIRVIQHVARDSVVADQPLTFP